jgi:hypothetical protein
MPYIDLQSALIALFVALSDGLRATARNKHSGYKLSAQRNP